MLCILQNEPAAPQVARAIEGGSPRLLSAATLLEAAIVVESRRGDAGGRELDLFLYRARIEIAAVDEEQIEIARSGWRRYGKGRHPAALNFGDCFAYALAKSRQAPLLFVGNDFAQTDIERVPLI